MVLLMVTARDTSLRLTSLDNIDYLAQPGDSFYELKPWAERYLWQERLLPLELLIASERSLEPLHQLHAVRRQMLVAQIQEHGAKLRLEELQDLILDLRRLILADFFMELYSAATAERLQTGSTQEGTGAGPGVVEDCQDP